MVINQTQADLEHCPRSTIKPEALFFFPLSFTRSLSRQGPKNFTENDAGFHLDPLKINDITELISIFIVLI